MYFGHQRGCILLHRGPGEDQDPGWVFGGAEGGDPATLPPGYFWESMSRLSETFGSHFHDFLRSGNAWGSQGGPKWIFDGFKVPGGTHLEPLFRYLGHISRD